MRTFPWHVVVTVGAVAVLGAGVVRAAAGDTVQLHIGPDLFIAGQNISIDQEVKGDLYAAGNSVTVNAPVDGDLFAAGTSVTVNRAVAGSARIGAQTVNINAAVGRTAMVGGANISFNPGEGAATLNNVAVAGAMITINQPVKGYLMVGGSQLSLNRSVAGESRFSVLDVSVGSGVKLNGPVTYYDQQSKMATGVDQLKLAATAGFTSVIQQPLAQWNPTMPTWRDRLQFNLILAATIFGFGILLLTLTPRYVPELVQYQRARPLASFLLGILALPALFAGTFLLAVSQVFLPLALLLLLTLPFIFMTGMVAVYENLGDRIMRTTKEPSRWLAILIGGVVLALVALVPVLGGLLVCLTFLLGLGSWFTSLLVRWRLAPALK